MKNLKPENYDFRSIVWLYTPANEDHADDVAAMCDEVAEFFGAFDVEFEDYAQAVASATPGGRFEQRGTCDHCGAHFHYGARFVERNTGESLIVGNVCATSNMGLTGHEYADKQLRSAVKRARSTKEANAKMRALAPNRRAALEYQHNISHDLRSKFRKYHALSIKQWALAKKLLREGMERDAQRAEERAKLTPIPADVLANRTTITGTVLTTKMQDGYYGTTYKMLVLDDRGFKVWGTVPNSIDDVVYNGRQAGATIRVEFTAAIDASDDDDTFGFFKRPTKASAEAQDAEVAA